MSYEYKGYNTPTEQSSLAGGAINKEEKLCQAKKAELKKKYRNISMALVGIIVVAVVMLVVQFNSGPPEQLEWSEWMDTLPDYATDEFYNIEEQTLYRSRNLETTSSTTQSEMSGWEIYDTVEGNGEFGRWSEWSASEVTGNENREVETQTRYRYRDKEITTEKEASMPGWNLFDTTYTLGDYGGWSEWSALEAINSDSRKVETKTQYSYRTISYETLYSTWSNWSEWSYSADTDGKGHQIEESDLLQIEAGQRYEYYRLVCNACKTILGEVDIFERGETCPNCGSTENYCRWYFSGTPYSSVSFTKKGRYLYGYVDGKFVGVFSGNIDNGTVTVYRYRTRTVNQKKAVSEWSNYGDTVYTESDSREVRSRTLYRFCDREEIPVYHFWRWGGWTDWSVDAVSATDNRQVETTLYYRYRDRQLVTTYYFQRWGDWSGYSKIPVTANDTTEVETFKQYRFKSKDN